MSFDGYLLVRDDGAVYLEGWQYGDDPTPVVGGSVHDPDRWSQFHEFRCLAGAVADAEYQYAEDSGLPGESLALVFVARDGWALVGRLSVVVVGRGAIEQVGVPDLP